MHLSIVPPLEFVFQQGNQHCVKTVLRSQPFQPNRYVQDCALWYFYALHLEFKSVWFKKKAVLIYIHIVSL